MGRTILHWMCELHDLDPAVIQTVLAAAVDSASLPDSLGATALHILCMNESISTELLRTTLLMCCEDSITQDVDERTPLHYLCSNIKVTPRVLEILFDSWPSAALVVDRDFKLPVQYLVDNPSSSPETTTLLICGPASYRHRYEFLSVNGQCACFTQGSEAVYVQTNVAVDSNTATKVLVNFYSPHIEIAPEDHNGAIVATSSDATITLDYALVMEAPLYTLESLRAEQICDTEAARAITTEVANCLVFWHCDARMVHGNITLQNVGQFEDRGLCLFNLNTSRELYEQRTIGSHAIALSSCPPEAAKAFIAKEEFLPTLASDMWQFGCIVYVRIGIGASQYETNLLCAQLACRYQLLSGSTLLERLAPWSSSIGHEQGLHLICSLTDAVLETLIAETEPEFRVLLQRTLIVNPSYRWGIDRLMLIEDGLALPSFVTSEAPSHDFVGKTLQQKTEDALADGTERSRSIKHAHEQLGFMKKEQSLLRHTLLSTKSQLRDVDQVMRTDQSATEIGGAPNSDDERGSSKARSTTRGSAASAQPPGYDPPTAHNSANATQPRSARPQAQSTGSAPPNAFAADPASLRRKSGPVQLLKSQLQHSVLAHGCVQKWANSSPSSALAATSLALSDENSGSNVTTDDTSDDNEEKARSQAEDFDVGGGAAAVA
ncbi:hypothetical protein ON010_g4959 [Phytophthora cinnamomi]|nr:hypothetical protein ON010_g4959 [Phytophthora cinnamomi]